MFFIAMLCAEHDQINVGDNNQCCEIKDTFTQVHRPEEAWRDACER